MQGLKINCYPNLSTKLTIQHVWLIDFVYENRLLDELVESSSFSALPLMTGSAWFCHNLISLCMESPCYCTTSVHHQHLQCVVTGLEAIFDFSPTHRSLRSSFINFKAMPEGNSIQIYGWIIKFCRPKCVTENSYYTISHGFQISVILSRLLILYLPRTSGSGLNCGGLQHTIQQCICFLNCGTLEISFDDINENAL